MKRGAVFILIGVLLLTFFLAQLNNNTINGNVVKEGERTVSIASEVLDQLENSENVKVYVKFKDSNKGLSKNLPRKVQHEFKDKVSMFISQGDLEELQNNPDVASVELVRSRQISLQDSVPLINGTSTWDLTIDGVNLTGEGQTICVIDTGIDYTHADFGGCYGDNNASSNCTVIGGWDYCADDTICNLSIQDSDPLDVEGHGTHVAGIVAANGSIKGVAPGAKLIVIKAANGTGTFWDDNLEAALDWCISNATEFNISVITMSLGGRWGITGYCDAQDALSDEIDAAFAAGIAVTAATGNDGLTDEIHGPACVQNAIPIGGSTKADAMYSSGNRNNLTQLLAPGVSINSTYNAAAYATLSGTSMATPHAAGVIALMNQYLDASSQTKTPAEIETALNNTGITIYDSGSGLNYSRIDSYSAIISLDATAPDVTLISPANSKVSYDVNQTFSCNFSEDLSLNSVSFYIWNSTGLLNSTSVNISGATTYTLEANQTNLSDGTYTWNCLGEDANSNTAYATSNYTLRIGEMLVALNSPSTGTYTNTAATNFNCSAEDGLNLSNATLYVWNSTGLVYNGTNNVNGTANSTVLNYTLSAETNFSWNCEFTNENGTSKLASSNYTITLDTTDPDVGLSDPDDGSTSTDSEVDFKYVPTDENGFSNCSLYLDDGGGYALEETDTTISNDSTNTFSNVDLSDDDYTWYVECYDVAGNSYESNERDLTVDTDTSTSSGDDDDDSDSGSDSTTSAGGGDEGPSIYYINDTAVKEGVNKSVKLNGLLKFNLSGEAHTMEIKGFTSDELTVVISSNPITLKIPVEETAMADVDGDKTYDIEVGYLNKINDLYVKISMEEVSVPVPTRDISEEEGDNPTVGTEESAPVEKKSFISWNKITGAMTTFWDKKINKIITFSVLGVLFLGFLGFLMYYKRNWIIDHTVNLLSKSQKGLKELKDEKAGKIGLSTESGKKSKKASKKKKAKDNALSREDFKGQEYF